MRDRLCIRELHARRRRRRRGAALVLVLIFGVGALMLVSTMLAMSRAGVTQEFEQHRRKELQAVLKAGIAAAVNEINRERREGASYVDPEGNGPGAVGCDGAGRDGVAVTAPDGRVLGRYRAVVERSSTRYGSTPRDILVVAAAWPGFTMPAGWTAAEWNRRQRVLAAEVEISRQRLPFGANALSVLGEYDKTKKFFKIDKKNDDVSITAPDYDVPAANFQDADLYNEFITKIVPELAAVEGADPSNPGSPATGADTVTNDPPGVISQETLEQIRSGIEQFAADALLDPDTKVFDATKVVLGGETTLPEGTYYLPGKLELSAGTVVRGSGTLIVTDELVMKKDAFLEWDGDIIVVDDKKAKLKVEKEGDFTMTGGVLAVVSDDHSAKLEFKKESDVLLGTVDAPVAVALIAGSNNDTAKFALKKDTDMVLVGILTVLASKKIEFKIDKESADDDVDGEDDKGKDDAGDDATSELGSDIDITGSVAFVMVDDGKGKTELKLTIKKGQQVTLTFDREAFDGALEELGEFFDPDSKILPTKVTTYWERPVPDVLQQQADVMDANDVSDWGMP